MSAIPGPPPQKDGGDDELARREREWLGAKPEVPELAESKRRLVIELMNLRAVLFQGAGWFARVALLLLILSVIAWWWHLIGPKAYRWLDSEEIEHLQALITSGALGALITAVWKKLLA